MRSWYQGLALLCSLIVLLGTGCSPTPPPGLTAAPGELIVVFRHDQSQEEKISLHTTHGATLVQALDQRTHVVQFPHEKPIEEFLKHYQADPRVLYAEPNTYFYTQDDFVPNDPMFSEQYNLKLIQAPAAWTITQGQKNILVAVVDTGVEANHPDLLGKVAHQHNFLEPLPAGTGDPNGHGTHCAGVIAANTNNQQGIASVAPQVQLMALRTLDARGIGKASAVADAIRYAADRGAHVINLSLCSSFPSRVVEEAIQYAAARNVMVIAAAGNMRSAEPAYPASYEPAVAVAAIDAAGQLASYSNHGKDWVDIAAPGTAILSTWRGNLYHTVSGTSMAAPHVTGLAALLLSQGHSPAEVRRLLEATADPLHNDANSVKSGTLNAYRALSGTPTP